MIVVQNKPAVRQTQHPAAVRTHAGQQSRAARRASGRGAKSLPEEDAFLGNPV